MRTHEFFELLEMANIELLNRPTNKIQKMKSNLVKIFFFNGPDVEATEVIQSDLPRLSGLKTFWLPMPDDELAKILKHRIGATLGTPPGQTAHRRIS